MRIVLPVNAARRPFLLTYLRTKQMSQVPEKLIPHDRVRGKRKQGAVFSRRVFSCVFSLNERRLVEENSGSFKVSVIFSFPSIVFVQDATFSTASKSCWKHETSLGDG